MARMLELDVGGSTQRVPVPEGQEITPEFVQSTAARLGAAASPAKQGQAQAAATAPQSGASTFMGSLGNRATDLAQSAASLTVPPKSLGDLPGKLGDAINVGAAGFAPIATGFGALIQAAGEGGGFTAPGGMWSQVLGGVAELAGGGVGMVFRGPARKMALKGVLQRDTKQIAQAFAGTRRTLTKEVEALGGADAWPEERISAGLRNAAHAAFGAREKPIKAALNTLEAQASRGLIQPGTGAYGHITSALDDIVEKELPVGGAARRYVDKLTTAVANGQPVNGRDAVKLRHILRRPQFTGIVGDPDARATTKLMGAVREKVTDAVELALKDNHGDEAATAYSSARKAYRIEITDPKRAIRSVLSSKRTPMQAFASAFSQQDPNAFRVLTQLAQKSPAMQTKLRLGYFESLRAATSDFTKASDALVHFKRTRPLLEASGLFKGAELDDITSLMRRQDSLQRAGDHIASQLSRIATGGAMSLMAGGATYAYTQDPKYLAMAAMASGAAPLVYKLAMLPSGSREGQRLAALIVRQTSKAAQAVFSEETKDPDEVEEQEP